jgi:hypothetical protein
MSDPQPTPFPKPTSTPDPDEVDPETGTEPDGAPVENPSGRVLT